MITRTIVLDLTRDDQESDRAALGVLPAIDNGSTVILNVGNRRHVTADIHWLRTYVPSLHLNVHGSFQATKSWEDALHARSIWGDE